MASTLESCSEAEHSTSLCEELGSISMEFNAPIFRLETWPPTPSQRSPPPDTHTEVIVLLTTPTDESICTLRDPQLTPTMSTPSGRPAVDPAKKLLLDGLAPALALGVHSNPTNDRRLLNKKEYEENLREFNKSRHEYGYACTTNDTTSYPESSYDASYSDVFYYDQPQWALVPPLSPTSTANTSSSSSSSGPSTPSTPGTSFDGQFLPEPALNASPSVYYRHSIISLQRPGMDYLQVPDSDGFVPLVEEEDCVSCSGEFARPSSPLPDYEEYEDWIDEYNYLLATEEIRNQLCETWNGSSSGNLDGIHEEDESEGPTGVVDPNDTLSDSVASSNLTALVHDSNERRTERKHRRSATVNFAKDDRESLRLAAEIALQIAEGWEKPSVVQTAEVADEVKPEEVSFESSRLSEASRYSVFDTPSSVIEKTKRDRVQEFILPGTKLTVRQLESPHTLLVPAVEEPRIYFTLDGRSEVVDSFHEPSDEVPFPRVESKIDFGSSTIQMEREVKKMYRISGGIARPRHGKIRKRPPLHDCSDREQKLLRQNVPNQDGVVCQESHLEESFSFTRQNLEPASQAQQVSERVQSAKVSSHSLDLGDRSRSSMRSLTCGTDDTSGGPLASTTRHRLRRSRPPSRLPVVHPLSVTLDSSAVNGHRSSQEGIISQPSRSRTSGIRWWHQLASSLGLLDSLPRVESKPHLRPLMLASSATVASTPQRTSSTRSVNIGG